MSLRESLMSYIKESLLHGSSAPVTPDMSLIETGMLDSVALMNLLTYVEDRTGVHIPDIEVTPENFETVETIEALVLRLRAVR
jgi:acyl carrier protein